MTLSDKRFTDNCNTGYCHKDVKEFIKELKEGIEAEELTYTDDLDRLFPIIDELAGDKLI